MKREESARRVYQGYGVQVMINVPIVGLIFPPQDQSHLRDDPKNNVHQNIQPRQRESAIFGD
jgi:hypothetical protein